MRVKTSELIGAQLDWAVAKCEGRDDPIYRFAPESGDADFDPNEDYSKMFYISGPERLGPFSPSTNWSQGGPILDRKGIWLCTTDEGIEDKECWWRAELPYRSVEVGPTPLIAAMRAYVAANIGDEAEIPEELV